MIKSIREFFNKSHTESDYRNLQLHFENILNRPIPFRIAETPVFVSKDFKSQMLEVTEAIIDFIVDPAFDDITHRFIPNNYQTPEIQSHPALLVIDYAVVHGEDGRLEPSLIELQGFPSLYGFQVELDQYWKSQTSSYNTLTSYLNGYDETKYLQDLKEIILGDEAPENVILLDLFPEKQKTQLDFICMKSQLGIESVCLTQIFSEGNQLFYFNNGDKIRIHRIFNRLVPDELSQYPELKHIDLRLPYDVMWINHPRHFFQISKCLLPLLKHRFIPECYYLSDFNFNQSLDQWVLKPLFSFAGSGVCIDVNLEQLKAIKDPENWIMQRKVHYAPIIETPDGPAKTEIRLFLLWKSDWPRPIAAHNLARLSKGAMIGTQFNLNQSWVGGTIAFFE
jgi:hypothetical protein